VAEDAETCAGVVLDAAMRKERLTRYQGVDDDEVWFADFYRLSWVPCLRAVAAVVVSPQEAEELTAEAFARAWARARSVRAHPAPRAWVVRTALNFGTSRWRVRRRERPLADHDTTVSAEVDDGVDAALLSAIRRLPRRQRDLSLSADPVPHT